MMSTSQPGWSEGAITLSTSRRRRPRAVPDHGAPEGPAGREAEADFVEIGSAGSERFISGCDLVALDAWSRREIRRPGEHGEPALVAARCRRQAVSCFLPRARRAASTRRPPGVFIRARKPCSLARWRFFGW